jgi:DNA mismatch repair protein MutS
MFNNILSQQIGAGCYKGAHIRVYDNFHSYMNIPDTSGRDSLFQAEARRCKDIIKCLNDTSASHLCIFDELYSGTNPKEAISSAMAFISYINKHPNTRFILTTHYSQICDHVEKLKGIKNYHMHVTDSDAGIKFSYKIEEGMSNTLGGVNVLKMMDYPDEIINDIIERSKE